MTSEADDVERKHWKTLVEVMASNVRTNDASACPLRLLVERWRRPLTKKLGPVQFI